MLVAAGWQSAVRKTWPKDVVVSHYTHAGARLIDHAMLNPAAEAALRFAAIDTKGADGFVASDHDPVVVDIELTMQTSRAPAAVGMHWNHVQYRLDRSLARLSAGHKLSGAYFLLTAAGVYSYHTARSAHAMELADGARPLSAPLTRPSRAVLEPSVGWMGIPVRRR
jgi:hypothetical protein